MSVYECIFKTVRTTTFQELAPFPAMSKGHCAVFLDKMTLMVIGGHEGGTKYTNTTFMLNINTNVWSPGPPMSMNRVAIQLAY